jgi:hypothetical protein
MSMVLSKDPLAILFGDRFIKRGFRQVDRDLLNVNNEINIILQSFITKHR